LVLDLMEASQSILAGHPVNEARIAAGKPPATSIWLWGQGRAPSLQQYKARFNIGGAVISAVDLVKGIGLCAGLETLKVPGATGYLDTNYKGKVSAALEALRLHDFVYLHVEAPDETSHEGKLNLKIKAIEDFDAQVVAPCLDHMRNRKDFRLLISPDHVTSLQTKTHAQGAVPFATCGGGITVGSVQYYSEKAAKKSGIVVNEGYKLVPHLLTSPTVDAATLARL
jgi:2,3-bisphosphoglycerate-independent phosphoglycerate mutase